MPFDVFTNKLVKISIFCSFAKWNIQDGNIIFIIDFKKIKLSFPENLEFDFIIKSDLFKNEASNLRISTFQ